MAGSGRPASPAASEALVAEMQQQLREGVDTCSRVLALQQPLPSEPVIYVSTGHLKTIDPCCLVRAAEGNLGPQCQHRRRRAQAKYRHSDSWRAMWCLEQPSVGYGCPVSVRNSAG